MACWAPFCSASRPSIEGHVPRHGHQSRAKWPIAGRILPLDARFKGRPTCWRPSAALHTGYRTWPIWRLSIALLACARFRVDSLSSTLYKGVQSRLAGEALSGLLMGHSSVLEKQVSQKKRQDRKLTPAGPEVHARAEVRAGDSERARRVVGVQRDTGIEICSRRHKFAGRAAFVRWRSKWRHDRLALLAPHSAPAVAPVALCAGEGPLIIIGARWSPFETALYKGLRQRNLL